MTSPEFGVRFELVLALDGERYEGFALLPGGALRVALVVAITPESARARAAEAPAEVPADTIARLEKMASALVRAATRSELEAGEPPPRKIVRWRALD